MRRIAPEAGVWICGVAGALLLVPTPVGVGAGLFAIVVVGLLVVTGQRIHGSAFVPVAMAFVGSLRSAEWVVLPVLGAAVGIASYQRSGSARRVIAVIPKALLSVVRSLTRHWSGREWALGYVRGVALGTLLLIVFGSLFLAADRAFASLASAVVLDLRVDDLLLRVGAFVAAAGVGGAVLLLMPPTTPNARAAAGIAPAEWGVALGLLAALFLSFCAVQIRVLFGGDDAVLDTLGLTYAEYAREGFFQLLAAATLTLGVVAGAARWARRDDGRQELMLRALLGLLCLCTMVVLASALRRLGLYEEAFGFTRLRVAAHAMLLWLAVVFILIVSLSALRRTRLLPGAIMWFSTAAMLVFAAVDPDALIAERNIERYRATGRLDILYLSTLSADAVPALAGLPSELRACAVGPIAARLGADDSLVAYNVARTRARRAMEDLDLGPPARAACDDAVDATACGEGCGA